jgi:hypothetical protein
MRYGFDGTQRSEARRWTFYLPAATERIEAERIEAERIEEDRREEGVTGAEGQS